MSALGDIIQSLCNVCGRETAHDVVQIEVISAQAYPDFAVETRSVVVRCRGCKDFAIRCEQWHFDLTPSESSSGATLQEVSFNPPRLWRRSPDWLSQLERIDADLSDMLIEIFSAANDNQYRLLAMGVRTALDYVMTQIVGDVGSFEKKLQEMVAKGHLLKKQEEILATVIDAGSAAIHRGFKPNQILLQEMVITMESIIREHYLTGPMLKTLKTLVPPRPPRPKP
jgi:hypothetical protein